MSIKLTEYSHGAGCGCKISPAVLKQILHTEQPPFVDANLLVGNDTSDDAAVYRLTDELSVVSTTDFFMPIVDDPFHFGRIAATNALSDVYAMGAKPIMAIAILGWPVNKLSPQVAAKVIEGGRQACRDAGIVLAGGHSIDAPEPIFGLAVTGQVATDHIKTNHQAKVGDKLFLTKPLGVGILTTAQKQKKLQPDDEQQVIEAMCQLNTIGSAFSELAGVHAMTDVTGFGLAGHLIEMCQGAGLSAKVSMSKLPMLNNVQGYIDQGCVPGGVLRNWQSYGEHIKLDDESFKTLLCDPQTSGGLLVSVHSDDVDEFTQVAKQYQQAIYSIGEMIAASDHLIQASN